MGRVIFRLGLAGVVLIVAAALAAPWFYGDEQPAGGKAARLAVPPPAPPAADPMREAASQPAARRIPLRYEERTAPEYLRPPPLPERSPARAAQFFHRVFVQGAGMLRAGDDRIRLADIEAPEPEDACPAANGGAWPCGRVAQVALARLIRNRAVACAARGRDENGTILARCRVGPIDIGEWVVRQGWAAPADGSPYGRAHEAAKAEGAGLWGKGAGN